KAPRSRGRNGPTLRPTVTAGLSFCADGGHAPSPPASPPPLVIAEASAPRSEAYVVEEPTTRGGASTVGPPNPGVDVRAQKNRRRTVKSILRFSCYRSAVTFRACGVNGTAPH